MPITGFGYNLRDGDWVRLRQILQQLSSGLRLGPNSKPFFDTLTVANSVAVGYVNITDEANGYQVDGIRALTIKGTSPNENIFIGQAGNFTLTGEYNICIGYNAGVAITSGNGNIFFGSEAGWVNTTGASNSFFGTGTGYANITGASNCFFGIDAGGSNIGGGGNCFFGGNAGYNNTEGIFNVFLGDYAGNGNTTGDYNVCIGDAAGTSNTTGNDNICIGKEAGFYETGSNKLFIDDRQRANEADARTKALIYGIMADAVADQDLRINADVGIGKAPAVALDVTGAITASGTGTFGKITIFNPIPILVFKDNTYAGDVSLGYIEWRDVNNTRLGFFGNSSSGNDDLYWKNESSGGHIKIETTGAGEFQILANTVLDGNLTLDSDSNKLLIGDGQDLELYHDGSDSYIDNNIGSLYIRGLQAGLGAVVISSADGGDDQLGTGITLTAGDAGDLTAGGTGKLGGGFVCSGGQGGDSDISGGVANTGGQGGGFILIGGTGGAATNGTSNTTGVGGGANVSGGVGGAGSAGITGGIGGGTSVIGGTGGGNVPTETAGAGGNAVVCGGAGGSAPVTGQANGGNVVIDGGAGATDGNILLGVTRGRVGIGTTTPTAALQMGNDKLIALDTNAGITASTTQEQGQGALTAQVNEISTVANKDDTVTLPSAITGIEIEIINNGVNTLLIFPASGDNLGLGVNIAEELEANERVKFVAYSTTNWAKESTTEIIHAEIHDEDNTDAFVINDAGGDFHSYHTNGLAAGDLADWAFDAGGAGTSHAITGIAQAGSDITVTTGDAHGLAVGDIISQTNLADAAYVGVFDVLTVPTTTTYTVTATYTATGTGTMDQAATLEADAVAAGVYSFTYCISATLVGNNETFDFQLYKEATAITGSKVRRKYGSANDFGSCSGCGVVSIANGDKISLALSNEDSAANIILRNLTIVLIRL